MSAPGLPDEPGSLPVSQWRGRFGVGLAPLPFFGFFSNKDGTVVFASVHLNPGPSVSWLLSRVSGPFFLLVRGQPLGIPGAGGGLGWGQGSQWGDASTGQAGQTLLVGLEPGLEGVSSVPSRTQVPGGVPLGMGSGGGRRLQGQAGARPCKGSLVMGTGTGDPGGAGAVSGRGCWQERSCLPPHLPSDRTVHISCGAQCNV